MKKFELTTEFITSMFGKKLFRIKALIEFGNVKAGELGGFVEKEENLSHDGNAWVRGNAVVCENAVVRGNAMVRGNAWVCENAVVRGNAWVCGNAEVCGNADYACIKGFGTEFRHTTFYKTKENGIGVKCGCFNGSLEQFREQVKETRNGKIAKEYLIIADLMEYHFASEGSDDE